MKKSQIFFVIFIAGALATISAIQPATGSNTLKQVIEINGTFPAGVSEFNVTISPSLTSLEKSVAFLTFEYNQQNQHRDTFRSWNFSDTSTLTIYGNDQTPSANFAVGFHGTIFEFTSDSDAFVQHLNFTLLGLQPEGEFDLTIPIAINASSAFIVPTGTTTDSDDTTVGVEEFTKWRIINNTAYGIEVGDTPNTTPTLYLTSIVDLNNTSYSVQRGVGSILSGESVDTITPTAFNKTNSMLFVSFNTNGDFTQDPQDVAVKATINGADDIIIERVSTSGANTIDYAWELIEFLDGFLIAQHFNGSQAGGTSVSLETIPTPVGNLTRSWAIGTVASPFGLGNGMSDSTTGGSFDRTTATITLNSTSEVELVRGDGTDSYDVGLQVIEFLIQAQDFTENILDVATAIDQGTQFNITKILSDTATANDAVIVTRVFNQTETDTATVTDVTNLNVTKLFADTSTGSDQTQLIVNKTQADTATANDAVVVIRDINQTATDTATVTDQTNLNVTKILSDITIGIDQTQFIINKTQTDLANVSDAVINQLTTTVGQNDTATTTDSLILSVTKILSDTASGTDQVQFNITKILSDTATVTDQTILNATGTTNQTASDTAIVVDQLQINITKIITETATTSDAVITNLTINQTLTEVAIVNDNVITDLTSIFNETAIDTATVTDLVVKMLTSNRELLDIISTTDSITVIFNTTIITPPSGGGGGGGSSTPPNFQRIQGLSIQSEEFQVTASDIIPSEFVITWFGQESVGVSVTKIVPDPDFDTWFIIEPLPQDLQNAVTIDNLKVSIDPTRITNTALQPYVLNVPTVSCNFTLDPNIPCFDPILYQIPVDFTFNKGGFPFQTDHIVTVDGRSLVGDCVVFGANTIVQACTFITFLEINWWWLASIAIFLMLVSIIWKRGTNLKVVRRISDRDLQSMSGEKIRRRKKFKKR